MDNNERQGYKMVIRNGCPNPPEDAYICPYCGKSANSIDFQEYNPAPWANIRNDSEIMGTGFEMPLVPSFKCQNCGCKWQWLPITRDTEKPEAEKPEPETEPEITIAICVKKPWYQQFLDGFLPWRWWR